MQILIRFPDEATERRALGKLIPRFAGKSWSSGETAVPSEALSFLADVGIKFEVIGPAPYIGHGGGALWQGTGALVSDPASRAHLHRAGAETGAPGRHN